MYGLQAAKDVTVMRGCFGAATAVQLWFAKRGVVKISRQDMNILVTATTATEKKIAHRIPSARK